MNKEEAIKKIQESDSPDFEVFTKKEHDTYLENFKKTEVENEIGTRIKDVHMQYDNDMFAITGKRKEASEKTYDFLKRTFNDLQTKLNDLPAKEQRIAELEKALKDKSGDELLKSQLQQAKDEYKKLKEETDTARQTFETEKKQLRINYEIDNSIAGIVFRDDVSEDIRNITINAIKSDLAKTADFVDNVLVFKDADGKILANKNNALNPYTAKELMAIKLESLVKKDPKKIELKKPEFSKDKDGNIKVDIAVPDAGFKDRSEVTKYLVEQGLRSGTPEYSAAYRQLTEGLPAMN